MITHPVSQALNLGVTLISLLLSPRIQLVINPCQVKLLYSSHLSHLYPYVQTLIILYELMQTQCCSYKVLSKKQI